MNDYERALDTCVRIGMGERLSPEDLTQPLLKQLAVLALLHAKSTGARLDDLIELLHIRLDEEVVKQEGPRNGTIRPR